jgi:hypothetical protein
LRINACCQRNIQPVRIKIKNEEVHDEGCVTQIEVRSSTNQPAWGANHRLR